MREQRQAGGGGGRGGSLGPPGLRCAILKAILSADVLSELAQKNLEMT